MTMFKYACHNAGIDISKINIIDAGNAREMDAAFVQGRLTTSTSKAPHPNDEQMELDMCLQPLGLWLDLARF